MTTREKFKRRVIELIHGLPYNEAIREEKYIWAKYDMYGKQIKEEQYFARPITIGRVMKALGDEYSFGQGFIYHFSNIYTPDVVISRDVKRKLTNEDGSECTDDDQSDETIQKLYELIK